MGETALNEDTFNEYLAEMREHYTADKVSGSFKGEYSLLTKDLSLVPSVRCV